MSTVADTLAPDEPERRGALARLHDHAAALDPGGFALRGALRSTLGLTIAVTAIMLGAGRAGQPVTIALVGGIVALSSGIIVSEPEPAQQRVTLACIALTACASASLATLVAPVAWLGALVFCAVIFAAALARSAGPRGIAVGLLAFLGYLVALYANVTPRQLPWVCGGVVAGAASAYVARFWVVRERPERVRRDVLRAFRARAMLLLDAAAVDALAPVASERRWREIRRGGGRLNELALALEQAVGVATERGAPPAVRDWGRRLFRAELAVQMLCGALHALAGRERRGDTRRALARTTRALQTFVEGGSDDARRRAEAWFARARSKAPTEDGAQDGAQDAEVARAWSRAERALGILLGGRPWAEMPDVADDVAPLTATAFSGGGGGNAGVKAHGVVSPDLRLAIQSTVAGGLAIVAGRAVSDTRWYWAVIAAFVVFIRANTAAETLSRAWQRVLGTVVGAAAGLGLAELVGGARPAALVLGLVTTFVAYYLIRISYTWMVVFLTASLGLLYGALGRPVPGMLALRMEETLVGAAIGVGVALVVLPSRSEARVRALVAAVLSAAAAPIRRATSDPESAAGGRTHDLLLGEIRAVDRALGDVRNAVRPLWGPTVPVEPSALSQRGREAAALALVVRQLATAPAATSAPELVRDAGARLADNCSALAEALAERRAPDLHPASALIAPLLAASAPGGMIDLLDDADAILTRLAAEAG